MERPALDQSLDSKTFRNFYYLKTELVDFCKKHGLPSSGGKIKLTDQIAHYLDTGEIRAASTGKQKGTTISKITVDTEIEENLVCSQQHRAFFKEHIGKSFSFNVSFQKWLKSNAGKTYQDAITAYYQILKEKKTNKTQIDSQFEYNTYIRDFFAENQGKSLKDAIRCWNYKKQLPGHNRYELSDLIVFK